MAWEKVSFLHLRTGEFTERFYILVTINDQGGLHFMLCPRAKYLRFRGGTRGRCVIRPLDTLLTNKLIEKHLELNSDAQKQG